MSLFEKLVHSPWWKFHVHSWIKNRLMDRYRE